MASDKELVKVLLRLWPSIPLPDQTRAVDTLKSFQKVIAAKAPVAAGYRFVRGFLTDPPAEEARLAVERLRSELRRQRSADMAKVSERVRKELERKVGEGPVRALSSAVQNAMEVAASDPKNLAQRLEASVQNPMNMMGDELRFHVLRVCSEILGTLPVLGPIKVPRYDDNVSGIESLREMGSYILQTQNRLFPKGPAKPSMEAIGTALEDIIRERGIEVSGKNERYHAALTTWTITAANWATSGFPMIRMSDELIAYFMATELPDTKDLHDLPLPWPTFFIGLPSSFNLTLSKRGKPQAVGLMKDTSDETGILKQMVCEARGTEGVNMIIPLANSPLPTAMWTSSMAALADQLESDNPDHVLLARLIFSVLLYLDTPRARERIAVETEARRDFNQRRGRELPSVWNIQISKDIKIDCRQWARDYLGGRHSSPAVQSMVRGHWQRYATGKGRTERVWMHRAPFWRGPVDAPVAVRTTKID